MADKAKGGDAGLEQELAGLRREYDSLRERKVRIEQDLANLKDQLKDLEDRARAEYGTSDPDKLQALLEEKRQENQRLVSEYSKHIHDIRKNLAAIEAGSGEAEPE
ncbi:MAG: hypothetical protein JW718_02585 [Desulfovibrionaceae bacterium]|nr:hypothetical protein [Desulfovibrionaceae bacterium]